MPLGSMQLVNHSCSPNCASDPVDSESSLELTVLKSIRPILKGELISYKYGGSFWRSRSALAACKRQQGCKLVVCQCATPCPNDYARFERVNPSRTGQVNEKPKDQDGRERSAPAKRRRKEELVTGSQSRPLHFGQLHHSEIGNDIQTEEPQTKCAQEARATQSNTQSHSPPPHTLSITTSLLTTTTTHNPLIPTTPLFTPPARRHRPSSYPPDHTKCTYHLVQCWADRLNGLTPVPEPDSCPASCRSACTRGAHSACAVAGHAQRAS